MLFIRLTIKLYYQVMPSSFFIFRIYLLGNFIKFYYYFNIMQSYTNYLSFRSKIYFNN